MLHMNWVVLLFINIFLYAVSTLLQRVILKKESSNPVAYSIIFQSLLGFFLLIYGSLFGSFSAQNIKPVLINLLLMAVFYGLGNIFVFKSLKILEASVFTIVHSSRVLFTILASTIFLRESLNVSQFLGIFLILSAIIIIYFSRSLLKFNKGVLFAFVASLFFGIEVTNDKYMLNSFNIYTFLVLICWLPALFSFCLQPSIQSIKKIVVNKYLITRMLILSFFYSLAVIFYFFALRLNNNSSQIASLNQLGTIVIVILAIIFLNEKGKLLRKFAATILAIVGAILLVR